KHQFFELEASEHEMAIIGGVERIYYPDGRVNYRPNHLKKKLLSINEIIFSPSGGIHTSTILAPAISFKQIPFNTASPRHEDWEWLLSVGQDLPVLITERVICERFVSEGEGLST